jgi:hypothetical protein
MATNQNICFRERDSSNLNRKNSIPTIVIAAERAATSTMVGAKTLWDRPSEKVIHETKSPMEMIADAVKTTRRARDDHLRTDQFVSKHRHTSVLLFSSVM